MGDAGLQAFYRRVPSFHHLGTGVQAIKLSSYRTGLAEPALQRFQVVAALPTCCFPRQLSHRGRSVDPRILSESFPAEPGILCRVTRRTFLDRCAPAQVQGYQPAGQLGHALLE